MAEQVYTIAEAAKLLRVSEQTIRRMIDSGQIEAQQIGRQWRIPKREIDRLLGNR